VTKFLSKKDVDPRLIAHVNAKRLYDAEDALKSENAYADAFRRKIPVRDVCRGDFNPPFFQLVQRHCFNARTPSIELGHGTQFMVSRVDNPKK